MRFFNPQQNTIMTFLLNLIISISRAILNDPQNNFLSNISVLAAVLVGICYLGYILFDLAVYLLVRLIAWLIIFILETLFNLLSLLYIGGLYIKQNDDVHHVPNSSIENESYSLIPVYCGSIILGFAIFWCKKKVNKKQQRLKRKKTKKIENF